MHLNFSPRRKLEDKRRMGIARVLNKTDHPTMAVKKRKKYNNKVLEETKKNKSSFSVSLGMEVVCLVSGQTYPVPFITYSLPEREKEKKNERVAHKSH